MRPTTEIEPFALPVDRDRLARRQVADQLGLEPLAARLEKRDRLLARPHLAAERTLCGDDLAHPRLDGGEILWRERRVAGEIVIEAVLDRGPDGDLGAGMQRLHRLGQHVRRIVADQPEGRFVLAGDEHHACIVFDGARQVGQHPVHLHRQRRARQPGTDRGRHLGARHATFELAHGTVGQGDGGHGMVSSGCSPYGVSQAGPQPWRPADRRAGPPAAPRPVRDRHRAAR